MGFLSLLEVSSMPILEVLIVGGLGAYMATDRCGLLTLTARKSINKIVFVVFTPALMFSNLAKTVTLKDIISWWFMPVNVGLTFLIGGILGWIMVKLLKPEPYLEGLVIAICSSANLGNLVVILIPAMCNEEGSPFQAPDLCHPLALSYASFSMAVMQYLVLILLCSYHIYVTLTGHQVKKFRKKGRKYTSKEQNQTRKRTHKNPRAHGHESSPYGLFLGLHCNYGLLASLDSNLGGFFIWTYCYQMVRISSLKYEALQVAGFAHKKANEDLNVSGITPLLKAGNEGLTTGPSEADTEGQYALTEAKKETMLSKVMTLFQQILEELMAPPTLGAIIGLIFGAVKWLKMLIIGQAAPFRVIQDSIQLLGDAAIPCITLILGGNLVQGIQTARLKVSVIIGVIVVKFILIPIFGVAVVLLADRLGFLPQDPLFRFVLLIQYALPPATNISTMSEFFHVGQEECSVIYLWTYLFSVIAITSWSVLFLLIVS